MVGGSHQSQCEVKCEDWILTVSFKQDTEGLETILYFTQGLTRTGHRSSALSTCVGIPLEWS